jgi:hypothetical protein
VPTAAEAAAVETTAEVRSAYGMIEATHTMAEAVAAVETTEASSVRETAPHMAVSETATPKMGDIYAAVGETAASEMGDTYAAETHAVMDDASISAYAHMAEAVAVPAIKYSPAGIVVIAKVIRACRSTPVSWVVDGTGRASSECHVVIWVGILGGGRL